MPHESIFQVIQSIAAVVAALATTYIALYVRAIKAEMTLEFVRLLDEKLKHYVTISQCNTIHRVEREDEGEK